MCCWTRNASVIENLIVQTTWERLAKPSGGPSWRGVNGERETPWDKTTPRSLFMTRPALVEAGGGMYEDACLVSRCH